MYVAIQHMSLEDALALAVARADVFGIPDTTTESDPESRIDTDCPATAPTVRLELRP